MEEIGEIMKNTQKLIAAILIGVLNLPMVVIAKEDLVSNKFLLSDNLYQEKIVAHSWIEISRADLEYNIQKVFDTLQDKSTFCAILKADAYGHGLALIMPVIIAKKIPCIGVANNSEIQTVRASGFNGQLMRVRSATLAEMQQAAHYNVEELIGNLEVAQKLSTFAQQHNQEIPFHLALNSTGISRNGLDVSIEKGQQQAKEITQLTHLKLVGIMSHFPVEELEDAKTGLAKFIEQSDKLIEEAKLNRKQLKLHIANSFATVLLPESHLDLVRPGGLIYGDTAEAFGYKRALSYKSRIAAINEYPAGNTVGYDRTYTLTRDSKLANIPVGYSDGYRRVFSNKGHVLIQGQRVPVLGKISMNTMLADVTDLVDVALDDEVVIFGKQGNNEISVDEIEVINDALIADLFTIWGRVNNRILVD